jgi:trigger factor
MNVIVEELEKSQVKLEIEFEPELLEEEIKSVFKRTAKRYVVPGFRKGRAPQGIVERYYGKEILVPDAIDAVCSECYEKAVEENGIFPVDLPEIEIGDVTRGEPVKFTAIVTVKPKVTLGRYKGIEIKIDETHVTEDDIEEELKRLADRSARLVPVEDRPTQAGDMAQIKFEGFIDGEPFEGGKSNAHTLELGSNSFIPGFEEQLVGKNVGDEVKVSVTFPESYQDEKLRGKSAEFAVEILANRVKELPQMDDEFAQDVSEFDTLDELKADLRAKIEKREKDSAEAKLRREIVDAVIADMDVYLPKTMLERRFNQNMASFRRSIGYDANGEGGFDAADERFKPFVDHIRIDSERDLKAQLAVEKIADIEAIETSDAELEDELRSAAKDHGQDYDEVKDQFTEEVIDSYRHSIRVRKTIDFLIANAAKA